jgi:hypothetical protein
VKTIRQLANEIGVSKQAVHKKMKKEPLSTRLNRLTSTVDGVIYVSVDGENAIKSAFYKSVLVKVDSVSINQLSTVDGVVDGANVANPALLKKGLKSVDGVGVNQASTVDSVVDALKNELDVKNKQIEDLTSVNNDLILMNKNLTAALISAQQTAAVAQALHVGTMHTQLVSGEVKEDIRESKDVKNKSKLFKWLFGS